MNRLPIFTFFLFLGTSFLWFITSAFTFPHHVNDLPERPTLTPTPFSFATPQPNPSKQGSQIMLDLSQIDTTAPQGWAIVQWQNEAGDWFDVKGWKSDLNQNNYISWWVAPENFGETPFRWLIYQQDQLFISPTFTLPNHSNNLVFLQADMTWITEP